MKFKKKLRKFFTLTRKGTGGFTLVELIVVIAILAILAGVGSVGYSGYVKNANKGNDKVLVGNIIRALETSAYSEYVDFALDGQYSQGIQIPVGFVVVCNEALTTADGKTGYTLALSNDEETDPLGVSIAAAMGNDYATTVKLSYDGWRVGSVSSSGLHNATSDLLGTLDDIGDTMLSLNGIVSMTSQEYANTDEMIIAVSNRIADFDKDGTIEPEDKTKFIAAWASMANVDPGQTGFGMGEREAYSAARMAYNNAFAEYVRANYDGDQNVTTLANSIANYGQSAGALAYEKAKETSTYKTAWDLAYGIAYNNFFDRSTYKNEAASKAKADSDCEYLITEIVNGVANTDTNFPYAATSKAFEDPSFAGYGDDKCAKNHEDWLKGQSAKDAAMFYDVMLTSATEGENYDKGAHGNKDFGVWFAEQAQAYSENFAEIERLVEGKSAIAIVVYYKDGILSCEVAPFEANPRED